MNVSSFKNLIIQNKFQHHYIFTGDEWAVQNLYLEQLSKKLNCEIVRVDSIASVYGKLNTKSFFSKPVIYVVRDDKELMSNEKLQTAVDTRLLVENYLIHFITKLDKRTKFYTRYKDIVVEFEPLSDTLLKKYIQKEIELSDKNCNKLIDVCEYDYGRCLLEIDKIRRYADANVTLIKNIYNNAFEILLQDGGIYTPPKDAIFDFVDAVLKKQKKRSFELLQDCRAIGESSMAILSVLYNNARAVLQVQECESSDISKSTGLNGWQIKLAKEKLNHYTIEQLVDMLKLILRVEEDIRSGNIEEEFVLDYLLVCVLR